MFYIILNILILLKHKFCANEEKLVDDLSVIIDVTLYAMLTMIVIRYLAELREHIV